MKNANGRYVSLQGDRMFESNLVDLDELALMVRDRSSRLYIGEAITAYRARAYRSALLATWTAVTYDIISKIRELELQGDPAAGAFVAVLENAIHASDRGDAAGIRRLQAIENELLAKALKDFELLSAQEYTDLGRLRHDRNLCAHPAFTKEAELFQPTAELVRAHIVHAAFHLLRHPPVQGRHALKRLKDDLLQASFPSSQKTASDFLEPRYLNHAKESLIEAMITVFLKVLIKQAEAELVGKEDRILLSLVAVNLRHPGIYARKMAEQLPRLSDGANDQELMRVCRLFKADKRCWGWLSDSSRVRVTEIAKKYTYSVADIDLALEGLEIDELRPLLLSCITRFSDTDKENLFSNQHRPEFIDESIEVYAKAHSFRHAEGIARRMILPKCGMLTSEQIKRILRAAEANGEIAGASGSPAFFLEVFERTSDLHEDTKDAWQHFLAVMMKDKDDDEHYSYPALRVEMVRVGMWPLAPPPS
jgi:hypothetical protein